jgi:hypothetical protein
MRRPTTDPPRFVTRQPGIPRHIDGVPEIRPPGGFRTRDERPADAAATGALEEKATAGATLPAIAPPEPAVPFPEAIVGDVQFRFGVVPATGWERPTLAFSLNKSVMGPQDAEAIIFWTSFPDGGYVSPCANVLGPEAGGSAADLAAAVATARGTALVKGPSDVIVGGLPAQQVAIVVRRDGGCDPGFFFTWPHDECQGACWLETRVGYRISVWIFEVAHTLVVIEAATSKQAESELKREIREIVETVRFDA